MGNVSNSIITDLKNYAESIVDDRHTPAVSLAVWKDGQLYQGAAGILNLKTGVEATADSIFQIGSITKVFTTCLVMQLVDEGRVELDAPVKRYLRDFQIADAKATQMITVRQLLNHTNGIAGDFFPDDGGCEGNPIARYVDRCNLLPIIHPIGEMYSYSNSAFAIAGRLIEVVLGISWYQAMQEFIYRPLGMNQAIADPAEAIRYRAAMGHVVRDGNADQWQLAEKAYLPLGLAPVGSTPTMSAANLITFARAHLDKGLSQSGERWLSTASIAEMQRPHIELPKYSHISCKYAGIGWGITDYNPNNTRVIGHGGATSGSLAMVNILPAQNSAYVILMNGFQPTAMDAINRDLLMAVAGIDTTEPDPAPTLSIPLEPYIGSYESLDIVIDIRMADEMLVANIDYKTDPLPPTDLALVPVDENCFAAYTGEGTRAKNLAFVPHYADDRPAYLFLGGRLNRRVSREKAI